MKIPQRSQPGDLGKFFWLQGVEAEVQPVQTGVSQWLGQGRQQRAVCRHRQRFQPGQSPQLAAEIDDPPPHQRFAAG